MARKESKPWQEVKGRITLRYGKLCVAAGILGCSVEGLRAAAAGRCPGIWERLKPEIYPAAKTKTKQLAAV